MADRDKAHRLAPEVQQQLIDRILFLGVTTDKKVIGHVVAGNSAVAKEFRTQSFPSAFVVFREIPLPSVAGVEESRRRLLNQLSRIHHLGWIDSKQLHADGTFKPCTAPQCGGFTLEAELGIPKNSHAEPDFLGWEVKQFTVEDFDHTNSFKPLTLLTPEPDGGLYADIDVDAFVRKFGYADKKGRLDRLNFGGRHFVGRRCGSTGLTLRIDGFDPAAGKIIDAVGRIALVSDKDEIAASWSFRKILAHWSRKHTKAVYVPSRRRITEKWQYAYGPTVRVGQGTDSLRLLRAFASGAMYYDPAIKIERASMTDAKSKKRSQFRVASRDVGALYATFEAVTVANLTL